MQLIFYFLNLFSLHCSYACVQEVVYIIAHNIQRFKLKYMGMSRVRLGTVQWFPLALCRGSGTSIHSLWSVHEMCGRQKNFKVFLTDILKSENSKCCVILFFEFPMIAIRKYWLLVGGFLVYLTDYFPSRIYTSAQCAVISWYKI